MADRQTIEPFPPALIVVGHKLMPLITLKMARTIASPNIGILLFILFIAAVVSKYYWCKLQKQRAMY